MAHRPPFHPVNRHRPLRPLQAWLAWPASILAIRQALQTLQICLALRQLRSTSTRAERTGVLAECSAKRQ